MTDERLKRAYGKRSDDLVETRAALAQAVDALIAELADRRRELPAFLEQRDDAVRAAAASAVQAASEAAIAEQQAHRDALLVQLAAAHTQADALAVQLDRALADLAHTQGLRIVRYTAGLRRIVFRLRTWR